MILVRADGNPHIGTGHVMRCLTIANALRRMKIQVEFIVADATMESIICESGFQSHILGSAYDCMDEELEQITPMLQGHKLLIVDSYYVTEQYLACLNQFIHVVYIDDLMDIPESIDFVINYNCYASKVLYEGRPFAKEDSLLGLSYIPLREEFQQTTYELRKHCTKILITTGGADEYNIASQLFTRMRDQKELEGVEYYIVVGAFNQHKSYLKELANTCVSLSLCENVMSMSTLMLECDLAISAGGSTLYELCAIGVPTIAFSFAANQERGVHYLGQAGIMRSAGSYQGNGEAMLDEVVHQTIELVHDSNARTLLHKKAQEAVDGKGAIRIAEAIVGWCNKWG